MDQNRLAWNVKTSAGKCEVETSHFKNKQNALVLFFDISVSLRTWRVRSRIRMRMYLLFEQLTMRFADIPALLVALLWQEVTALL